MLDFAFIRFVLVGIGNTIIGLSIIYVLMYFFRLNIIASNFGGYILGALFGYAMNRVWTFKSNVGIGTSFFKYSLVMIVAYLLNLGVVLLFSSETQINPYLVQAFGVVPYTLFAFFGSKYFVFSNKSNE